MRSNVSKWERRFRNREYPTDPEPSAVLRRYLPSCPEGRALDVATGTGRNAVFLAERGYEVDAIDQSRAGLEIARETATDRGVGGRINWIQADLSRYVFPPSAYDLVTISFYRPVDRLPDIKAALRDGGVLFVQHHLRSSEPTESGSSDDRYRFAANELLHAAIDLTVLYYAERSGVRDDGRRSATVELLARNSSGTNQTYPRIEE